MEFDASDADALWLGVDALLAPLAEIEAVLVYRAAWNRRIIACCGRVPEGTRAVVLLRDGRALPSRRSLDDLEARWAAWRTADDSIEGPAARPEHDDEPSS